MNSHRSRLVHLVPIFAVGCLLVGASTGVLTVGHAAAAPVSEAVEQPSLDGSGLAVFKVAIQPVNAETAIIGWIPPNAYSRLEDEAGKPTRGQGKQHDPTGLKVSVTDDKIPGLRAGDIVAVYRLSSEAWYIKKSAKGYVGVTPTAGMTATGWTY